MAPKNISNFKNQNEEIEYYVPEKGLDLDYYMNINKNSILNNNKAKRLRKQAIHHLGRYKWAEKILSDKKDLNILDIACGAGYGTYLLSEKLPNLNFYGADYDARAIQYSQEKYGHSSNRKYIQFDLETWESNVQNLPIFDVIISFDTIEHVNHRDIVLVNLAENLPEDGMLLLSTPVHLENKLKPEWEYHKIEYGLDSFKNLIHRFFKTIIEPKQQNFPELSFWTDYINGKDNEYCITRYNPLVCKEPIKHAN